MDGLRFPRLSGYEFKLTQSEGCAVRRQGFGTAGSGGSCALKDWLVLLRYRLKTRPKFRYILGARSNRAANHSLWISTTTPDVEGAFEKVLDLPTEEWERSSLVDLSAWGGNGVYLAWYYEGQYADDWYIDDVDVREFWSLILRGRP